MGKQLIIKGADFSENALVAERWYNRVDNLQGASTYSATVCNVDPVAIDAIGLVGKTVNVVRIHALQAGTIKISAIELQNTRQAGTIEFGEERSLHLYDVSVGENIIRLAEPIVLVQGETIRLSGVKNIISYSDSENANEYVDSFGVSYANNSNWTSIRFKCPIEFGYVAE